MHIWCCLESQTGTVGRQRVRHIGKQVNMSNDIVFFWGAIPDHMFITHFDPVPTFAHVGAEAPNTFEVCAVSKTIYECGALYAL